MENENYNEGEGGKLLISVSPLIPIGEFIVQLGDDSISGTITDLGDSFAVGGFMRSHIEKGGKVVLMVSEYDWENNQEMIWRGDTE